MRVTDYSQVMVTKRVREETARIAAPANPASVTMALPS
jgi:hypothetical protein